MSIFVWLMFPAPASAFLTIISITTLLSMGHGGLSEVRGKHVGYSKFWNANTISDDESKRERKDVGRYKKMTKREVSSKRGMLFVYAPASIVAAASFHFSMKNHHHLRSLLLSTVLTIHFLKRTLEVLFIHVYSGSMMLESVITISTNYTIGVASHIYSQSFIEGLPDPKWDLKFVGLVVFFASTAGNFYHHCLLARLRKNKEEGVGYKIPQGGLFGLVVCPHYLFEILAYVGISFISQTVFSFCNAVACMLYLTGRSHATRQWYLKKFEKFPSGRKALVPYIF